MLIIIIHFMLHQLILTFAAAPSLGRAAAALRPLVALLAEAQGENEP